MTDFLSQFMGNTERAKLVRAFVFDESRALTIPEVAKRTGLAQRAVEREVEVLEKMGIVKRANLSIVLKSTPDKKVSAAKQKVVAWGIDADFTHARALSSFVHEISPMQHDVLMQALRRTGKLATVILSGAFMGDPSRPADLLVAADAFNERRLDEAVRGLEPAFGREIRYAAFTTPEFRYRLTVQDRLIRDTLDYPHLVLLDRTRML
jgi:DNA-binding Lrp family transcriptional regulator